MGCGPIFLWSVIVLFMFQVVVGLTLNNILMSFLENSENSLESRKDVWSYFGTFSKTILTMWELTLGNYAPVSNLLVVNVGEVYGYVITTYKVCVGFAVVKVITGVFLHETFRTANSDDELMIMQKRRSKSKHVKKMLQFLTAADDSNDGVLQREELKKILENPDMKVWLSAQDLDVVDVDLLFDFLDGGEGHISSAELISGVARLKGAARSIDLVGLMHMTSSLNTQMKDLFFMFNDLRKTLDSSPRPAKQLHPQLGSALEDRGASNTVWETGHPIAY